MPQPIPFKDHEKEARLVRSRLIISSGLFVLLVLVLLARMYYLQVIQYEYHSTLSENNRVHVQPIPPPRGLIYDRNGNILADNRPSFSLSLTRERAGDWRAVLDLAVEVLGLTPEDREIFERRALQGRRPFEPVPIMFELSEEQIARIAENQFRLPGLDVTAQLVRHYPYYEHFAHSVGYVGRINEQEKKTLDPVNYSGTHHIGKTGIEKFYEDELHGTVGYEEVETNARGRVLRVLKHTDPIAGKDLVLSLDMHLQEAAENALAGRRGAIVALDPNNGEILAMVSQPGFNPNSFVTGISFKEYGELRDSIDRPLYNRVLRGLYPPGSTIKPQMSVIGLDAGVVTPSTKVFDPGYFQLPNVTHKYRNWNRGGDGWVNMDLAMQRSNDTYFYDMATKLGVDRIHDYMSRFGFGRRIAQDLNEETGGLMPSREWKRTRYKQAWYPGETVILGIGQGYMQVTPLQLAQATALIATRGVWRRPHLAKTLGGAPAPDPDPEPNIELRDPKYWDIVRDTMVSVVHGPRGTGKRVGLGAKYRIAGKSGTAQVVAIRQGERYDRSKVAERHRDHALFVAFAPAENPQIVVAVMVENGESGSGVAGPVAREVMDAWLLDEQGNLKEFIQP